MIIRILKVFVVLIFGNIFSLFAQSTEKIVLEFYQIKEYHIALPCVDISRSIDTIYNKQDTLFIEIIDDRIFCLDSSGFSKKLYITGDFYSVKAKRFKKLLEVPTTKREYDFIGLQIYDQVYIFKKKIKKMYMFY